MKVTKSCNTRGWALAQALYQDSEVSVERPFNADDILVATILAGKPEKFKKMDVHSTNQSLNDNINQWLAHSAASN